jgi:hypothetical protein
MTGSRPFGCRTSLGCPACLGKHGGASSFPGVTTQKRVLAGHVIGRAIDTPADAAWRDRFRDTRHLLDTVQAILDQRMPLSED